MEGLNRVTLAGNVGSESDLHFTQGGSAVLNIRLATNESWLDKEGQRQERTEWTTVVVFNKRAEALAKILRKGMPLLVEGRLQTSSWEDKQDGTKRYRTDVIATNIILLGSPPAGSGASRARGGPGGGGGQARAPKPAAPEVDEAYDPAADPTLDQIPFVTSAPNRWGL